MSNIVLQPCAAKAAQEHYQHTVQVPVVLDSITTHLTLADSTALRALTGNDAVALWGAKPGEDHRNAKRWRRVAPGDYLLFVHGAGRISVAEVLHTFQNAPLATHLWGTTTTANGHLQTWEYMFAIGTPISSMLSNEQLNSAIGRKPNANVQEFVVLEPAPSSGLMAALGLRHSPASTSADVDVDVSAPTRLVSRTSWRSRADQDFEELDELTIGLRRKEQAFLRRYVLPGTTGICALCERVMPIQFLVAAHIKQRSTCTDRERRDFENIVMPNCRLGCDELFGRGLVSIDPDGVLQVSPHAPDVGAVAVYVNQHLQGRRPRFWADKPDSRKYFDHHHAMDFQA